MKSERQTSKHLLLASVVTMVGIMLMVITIAFSWELWMVPIFLIGNSLVWFLHIGKYGSDELYENLCTGLLLIGFFFFGVHSVSLFDIPAVACMVLLIFSMLDKRLPLYTVAVLYLFQLLYHCLILHTITLGISIQNVIRLGLGATVVAGAVAIARYRINRRIEDRKRQRSIVAQLEAAKRQNAEFLSNVSHEFRTPVNMVLGLSEVALEKNISSDVREDIHSIQMAGKRLSNQISKILDYTEIVEGTLTSSNEEYMITSVLNDVMTTTALQSSKRQLEMVFDIDPQIPSVLIGDAEKLSHVLKILLENSIKFTEEGGIDVCIEFRRESYGLNLLIDVYDTGIGMTDSQLAKMYDDFYQADSGSDRFAGGLGLGIPIARGLLHAMGGFMHCDSTDQQGIQIHVTIPQGIADETPSMEVADVDRLCIACYFRPDRYSCDAVRKYYDKLILHLVNGLGIEGYQAHNFEGLLKLHSSHALTHVFIAQSEYEENSAYYEELANTIQVAVIAEKDFVPREDSKLLILRKPFFALAVVNLLNGNVKENRFEETQAAGRRPFTCEGVRVLVVDDEEMNLVVAKGVLGSYGIKVDACLSGREALDRCTSNSYDMVFLDHMMPGFDGVETLRRIREMNNGAYRDLPVIALTANTISGAREMFRHEGFTEFVPKPIERTVLERVLRRVLPAHSIRYCAADGDAWPEAVSPFEPSPAEEINGAPVKETNGVPAEALGEASLLDSASPSEPAREDKPADEVSIPYTQLVQAGFDVQAGLDYCCGDESFYLEMLRMFFGQSEEKRNEIIALYKAANWTDYAVKVHALKSTSLTIGAKDLSEQAKLLERAGKSGDAAYIHQNHPHLLELYEEICKSIAGL
ncbi:MAG: response regulator [Oscillibacter sp.]|nr:response regulator [Oscillospiraceae bacterium]MCI8810834.1 response regulator [Oscillibacter sp.]